MFWSHPVTMETDRLILVVNKCYRSKRIDFTDCSDGGKLKSTINTELI